MDKCIVVFATAWGSQHGGINSFNYDICIHLAKSSDLGGKKVVCILEEKPERDIDQGVTLIHLPSIVGNAEGDAETVACRLKGKELETVYVMGHDAYTGQRAIHTSKHLGISVAVFHHMDYEAYKTSNATNDQEKISKQEDILLNANIVFAVGPKLEISARDKIRCSKIQDSSVVRIQPGLATVSSIPMPGNFSAITFGRVKEETRILKQIDLAVASFGEAAGNLAGILPGEPRLFIVGMSQKELAEKIFKPIAERRAKKITTVHEWPYENNRDNLLEMLKKQSVCMMLSCHDGFGLTGLEAISAEVPLILSKNTGLYLAITDSREKGGLELTYPYPVDVSGLYKEDSNNDDSKKEITENDISQVVKWLYHIAKDCDKAKRQAETLRQQLSKCWTWEKAASKVLESIQGSSSSTYQHKHNSSPGIEPDQNHSFQIDSGQAQYKVRLDEQLPKPPTLRIVASNPEISRLEPSNFDEAIANIKTYIKSYLSYLNKSDLKVLLDQDAPLPQVFEEVDFEIEPVENILRNFEELFKDRDSKTSKHLTLLNSSYELVKSSKECMDILLGKILILKEFRSRKSGSYKDVLCNAKRLFSKAQKDLEDAVRIHAKTPSEIFLIPD